MFGRRNAGTSGCKLKKTTVSLSLALAASVTFFPLRAVPGAALEPARLVNLSGRLGVDTADNVMIAGFIITGDLPKKVIIRGLGPSLAAFGLSEVLADPLLELHEPDGTVLTNDNWKMTQANELRATGLAPGNDLEAAIVATFAPGAYTAVLRGVSNTIGLGLLDIYDLDYSGSSQIANLSIRGKVEGDDKVMIAGVISAGEEALPVIVRAVGPSLAGPGVEAPLPNPALELHDSNGLLIASNDNWKTIQETEIVASDLAPLDDLESAIVLLLPPGPCTAIVRGQNGQSGVALLEVYQVAPIAYSHVFVIVLENVGYENIIGSSDAPYINQTLLPQATLYNNSFALGHPSLPNYLALFAGSTFGVTNDHCVDGNPPNGPFDARNIYSELQTGGKTALAYMESLPFAGYEGCKADRYVQRHNPFRYFNNVPSSATVVYEGPYSSGTSWPDFVFLSPNLINDMHDGASVAQRVSNGDSWLWQHLPPLITYAREQNGLIILTMDENDQADTKHIPTIVVGDRVAGGQVAPQSITHYNVTKTITANFGVDDLGESEGLAPLVPLP
jgi:phosphatidylinositol-3-phosphatase